MIVMNRTSNTMGNHTKTVVNSAKVKGNPVMRNMQEIVPGLYLGSNLAHEFETLVNTGITHVICVRTKEEEEYVTNGFPDWFRYKVINLDDSMSSNVIPIIPQELTKQAQLLNIVPTQTISAQPLLKSAGTVKDFIDDCLKKNGKVLVQSFFGTSRSAILVIGYIMETFKMTLRDAIEFVQNKRTCINPNQDFLNQLRDYEAIYKARKWYNSGHSSKQTGFNKRRYDEMEGTMQIDAIDTPEPQINNTAISES